MNFIKIYIIFGIFLSNYTVASEKTTINFAPLPMKKASKNIQDFVPMNSYIEQKTSMKIKYIYKNNYQDILNSFKNGQIDIAYLGPLPLVSLKKQYPHIKPLITFNQKNGSNKYRCVLAKFKQDNFNPNENFKVALTQPLSTCGYFMVEKLLKNNYNIELKNKKYEYTMSHYNAMLSVLGGEYLLAGAKDSIAKKFDSVGMEIIAKSEPLPGFSLIANTKTLSSKQIALIKNTLLSIPKETYKTWKGVFSNGFVKASLKDYDIIHVDYKTIPTKGNIK
jgi:phosphonate transport system substrate-binding protein